ncbi:hypothetical protein [Paenibacillus silvae]|uniref:hypothetical protein n=1 Tax=Paenibacillus silvae TaxID=1325358 RepID=UPI0020059352|nr:hypothetical protein [Paenibacillus silvae]MCK6073964.1 hypothetical protein [Paenibacillus silvae]MCK6148558.1 hypothetical protein [Paenibacillus silvae]MCK6266859.1 hypothetical protein [Paenibacillus silvae]
MRYILWLLWLAFIVYALFMAPGNSPGNDPIFRELLTLQSRELWLLTVFSWLGIFPCIYACLLLRKSVKTRGTRNGKLVPVWPFVLFSFGLGAFALLPYYAWTSPSRTGSAYEADDDERTLAAECGKTGIARVVASKLTHLVLLLLTLSMAFYAVSQGNPERYAEAFNQSSFVNIMTIDFGVLTLLSTLAILRDARDNRRTGYWAWLGLLPLAGPLLYLFAESEQP